MLEAGTLRADNAVNVKFRKMFKSFYCYFTMYSVVFLSFEKAISCPGHVVNFRLSQLDLSVPLRPRPQ